MYTRNVFANLIFLMDFSKEAISFIDVRFSFENKCVFFGKRLCFRIQKARRQTTSEYEINIVFVYFFFTLYLYCLCISRSIHKKTKDKIKL